MQNKAMFAIGIKPFIKWRGGKRKLASQIIKRFPDDFGNYYEPFLGGGAVFLRAHYLFTEYAFLSDINPHLVNAWRCVSAYTQDVLDKLEYFSRSHSKEFFYQTRHKLTNAEYHDENSITQDIIDSNVWSAAAFIYINKATFNGLWRTNLKGELNMPFGRGQLSPGKDLVIPSDVWSIAKALRNGVQITSRSYSDLPTPKAGSLIYCDPPYDNTNTMYHKTRFHSDEQEKLRDKANEWGKSGCYVMVSNMDTPFIRHLYQDYRILEVLQNHIISGRATGRRKVREVLITNY